MKAISPMISAVLLILIILLITITVAPWMREIATDAAKSTEKSVEYDIVCNNLAYDFDPDYGTYGVMYNFTGTNDTISVAIINTGYENIYDFSLELIVKKGIEYKLITGSDINITDRTQKSKKDPLKPGESHVLVADVIDINETWQLTNVKVLNGVCPSVYAEIEL